MIKFKKSLGQNLLIDKNILNKIVSVSKLNNKNIIEIGAGTGLLTKEIIKQKPYKIYLIEKDKRFIKLLEENFKNKNIFIINEDILKININKLIIKDSIILGNLPYNISSQILVKFIKMTSWPPNYERLIFMFQKEVGEKIIANFKSKNYSRLSILVKSRFKILNHFNVSKNCFLPKPKVDSMVIELKPIKNEKTKFKDINSLEFITNVFFSYKRKMINKALKKLDLNDKKIIDKLKINPKLRPEKISEELYFKIAEYYEKNLYK